jgi:hypothetical protein
MALHDRASIWQTARNCDCHKLLDRPPRWSKISDIFCNSLFMISLDKRIRTGRAPLSVRIRFLQFCLCKKRTARNATNNSLQLNVPSPRRAQAAPAVSVVPARC